MHSYRNTSFIVVIFFAFGAVNAFCQPGWFKKEISDLCRPSERQILGSACKSGDEQAAFLKIQMDKNKVVFQKCLFHATLTSTCTDCGNNYVMLIQADQKYSSPLQKLGFGQAQKEDYQFSENSPSNCP